MPKTNLYRRSLLAVAVTCASSASYAVGLNELNTIGANKTQQSLGRYVQTYIDVYNENSNSIDLTDNESALLAICNDYRSAALRISNEGQDGEEDQAIREYLSILNSVAHDEVGAQGSGTTDTGHDAISNVESRLQALRSNIPGAIASSHTILSGGAAGDEFSKLSYYSNLSYGDGSKDQTANEQGFDFSSYALNFGVDYRFDDASFSDDLVAGVALSYGQSEVDASSSPSGTDADTLGLTFYGTATLGDWFIDATLGYAMHGYDSDRTIYADGTILTENQNLSSSTDGTTLSWSIGGGSYQRVWGLDANYGIRLDAVDSSIDGYTENGGTLALNVGDQELESLQAVISGQLSKVLSADWGIYAPYAGLEIHQEFEDETRIVTAQYRFDRFNNQFAFTSDDADSNYFVLSLGSTFVLPMGSQLFINLDHILGLDEVSSNTLTAGFRMDL